MAIRIQVFLAIFFICTKLPAQTCDTVGYSHTYWFKGIQSSLATKALPGSNNTTLLFGNIQVDYNLPSSHYALYITTLNSRGTPLQTKTLTYNSDVIMYDAVQSAAGSYFVAGFSRSGNAGADPWVAKLDVAGNPVWSFGLGRTVGAFFKIQPTQDGGCITAGRVAVENTVDQHGNIVRAYNHAIVFKLDNTGEVIWGREFYTRVEVEQVFEVLQLKDGSVMVSGVKNNSPDAPPGSDFFIMKLDGRDGHTLWQKESAIYFGQITELSGGSLLFRQSNFLFSVNPADGSILSATTFTFPPAYNNNYDMHYAGSFSANEDLYYDFVDKKDILLFKMVNRDSIAWVTHLPGTNAFGKADNPFSAYISRAGSTGIYLSGGITSRGLSTTDSISSEENSFLLKTNLEGISPCTDTLQIPVVFSSIPPPALIDFAWDNSNSLTFNHPRPLVQGTAFAAHGVECYSGSCCTDTTVNTSVNMCVNSTYTLPGGAVINKGGLYSVILKRVTGCDSIIFITVNALPPSKPHLGNDTCFIANPPVVLKANVPADSYRWKDGSTDSLYKAILPGDYWVQATNVCGVLGDTLTIFPDCSFPLYIPNAFTPNNDGINDVFRIQGLHGQKLMGFSIYNRWGQLVFKTTDANKGWDGTISGRPSPSSTFVYMVYYRDLFNKVKYVQGTVNLIR